MSELLAVDAALQTVLAQVAPLPAEELPLADAPGRYLAKPLHATFALPPFTNSAMDGFAIRADGTPGDFAIIGESAAGAPFEGRVGHGEAVTISTGAVLPAGADAVVPIEDAWVRDPGRLLEVQSRVRPGAAIRTAGSDVERGAEVLPAGARMGPAQIGVAASLGRVGLSCGAQPSVAVLTTGTELRSPGEPLAAGQIYDSNGPLLTAALASAGARVTVLSAAADARRAHRDALVQALTHDVVISTGGVSVGGHDLVREVQQELGVRELFWRIALKPGKPLSFGVFERSSGTALVFGIPGNPVSVLVCFELFVRPALAALQGARDPRPVFAHAVLTDAVQRNPERDELIRVREAGGGRLEPLRGQQSHQIAAAACATGLARIPAGRGTVSAGDAVDYLPLS